jgi:hypothetical protein
VDVAVLEALVGDNRETTCVILEDYLLAARQQAVASHTAFVDGDIHTVGAIGHRLKSTSRAVRASRAGRSLCGNRERGAS